MSRGSSLLSLFTLTGGYYSSGSRDYRYEPDYDNWGDNDYDNTLSTHKPAVSKKDSTPSSSAAYKSSADTAAAKPAVERKSRYILYSQLPFVMTVYD